MADLRSVVYGSNTFTIPQGGSAPDLTSSVAPVEVSPSQDAYTVGQLMMYNDQLYEVIADIAIDDVLTPGGNIRATNVSSQLAQRDTQITTLTGDVATLTTAVTALQTQLDGYQAVLLQLNGDGSNRTAYDVLGKVHDLRPLNMFEARAGAYDVNGNWLGDIKECNLDDGTPDPDTAILYYDDGSGVRVQDVFIDRILTAYPTTKGIVLRYVWSFANAGAIKNATSGVLDWMVITNWSEYSYEGRITSPLFDGGVTDAVGTIYIEDYDMTDAPWGQTNATINTTGTPVPWTE